METYLYYIKDYRICECGHEVSWYIFKPSHCPRCLKELGDEDAGETATDEMHRLTWEENEYGVKF